MLLAAGTGAIDTSDQVQFVAATYGLARCDVDVTYNSIVLSAHRGPTMPPASTMRIVHYRSMDFTRLAAVDRLTRRIRRDAISPAQAREELLAITSAPAPLPPVGRDVRVVGDGRVDRGAARRWPARRGGRVRVDAGDRPG